ncbi:phage-shock protein [Pseudodesulfovibrio senegalensis]|jgi:phage shock protein B|uniref:Phage-shock protein n=1 Tax=Pseudodesulfovibrio senegalensis TaxID=1721087 RepID=A0A6N6N610_9BACT|nr:phage-shock protein [Pseudodesulfovibrio senegalensis]KAB1442925.1 phage-shock protein [Pseudodesulfovibrio senegalensis]
MGHFVGAIFLFILAGVVLVGAVLVGVVKAFRSSPRQSSSEEETRMIQEMYNAMNRMESRVESLETILLERENKQ